MSCPRQTRLATASVSSSDSSFGTARLTRSHFRSLGAIQQSAGVDEFQSAMFAESMDQMMVAAAVENGANASER